MPSNLLQQPIFSFSVDSRKDRKISRHFLWEYFVYLYTLLSLNKRDDQSKVTLSLSSGMPADTANHFLWATSRCESRVRPVRHRRNAARKRRRSFLAYSVVVHDRTKGGVRALLAFLNPPSWFRNAMDGNYVRTLSIRLLPRVPSTRSTSSFLSLPTAILFFPREKRS